MPDTITIDRNDATRRYELTIGDELAGIAEFRTTPDGIVFTHTVVRPEFGGQRGGQRGEAGDVGK